MIVIKKLKIYPEDIQVSKGNCQMMESEVEFATNKIQYFNVEDVDNLQRQNLTEQFIRKSSLQLGWNCFDEAIGLANILNITATTEEEKAIQARAELVKRALNCASEKTYRDLLAPEIKHAVALSFTDEDLILPATAVVNLPLNMCTHDLKKLYNSYQNARDEPQIKEIVTKCNDAIGNPEGKRLSIDELKQFFQDDSNCQTYQNAYDSFSKAYSFVKSADNDFIEYCSRESTYCDYISGYYGENRWFAFQRKFRGESSTSMVDVTAKILNIKIVIYQDNQVVHQTESYGPQVSINYNGKDHFTPRSDTSELVSQSKRKAFIDNEDEKGSSTKKLKSNISFQSEGAINSDTRKSDSDDQLLLSKSTSLKRQNAFNGRPNEYSASGLKHNLGGIIYQLKLLILFLKRGLDQKYAFRLATEMDEAEKFDDLVFQYENTKKDKIIHRFLQAKHKQDESKKISANNLLTDTDDDFSLQKYFISYRKIKKSPTFHKDHLKDFIICTNINFDFEKLKSERIETEEINKLDPLLKMNNTKKQAKCYKLKIDKKCKLYETLRKTSDLYKLAKELIKHIKTNKTLTLATPIFKLYRDPLMDEVFSVIDDQENINEKGCYVKFRDSFLRGNSELSKLTQFRNILKDCSGKAEKLFYEEFSQKDLSVSSTFGKKFKLQEKPLLRDVEKLAEEMAKEIKNAKDYHATLTRNGVIKDNIDRLAGHVFIKREKAIKFRQRFIDDDDDDDDDGQLPGNLGEFKKLLKIELEKQNIEFGSLQEYKFKISNFQTCEEEEVYSKQSLPNDYIQDEEIDEFLDKLVFAVNQPNEIELDEIIQREVGNHYHFNLLNTELLNDSFQRKMLDWFKEKGKEIGKEGKFLTNEDAEAYFDSIAQNINVLICAGLSSVYPEELKSYNVQLICCNERIENFLKPCGSDRIQVLNVIVAQEPLLTSIKVYQTLDRFSIDQDKWKKDDSYIFIQLNTLLKPRIQKIVIDAFKSLRSYCLLMIDCTSMIRLDTQKLAHELFLIIRDTTYKKIILISEEKNPLANLLKEMLPQHYTENNDASISFADLNDNSQVRLLENELIFQGKKISLNKLIDLGDENSKTLIDSQTLVKLIKNDTITIGNQPLCVNDLEAAYIRLYEDVTSNLVDTFLNTSAESTLFMISGIERSDTGSLEDQFIHLLELRKRNIEEKNKIEQQIGLFEKGCVSDRRILISLGSNKNHHSANFKFLCWCKPENMIYWIHRESNKFVWKLLYNYKLYFRREFLLPDRIIIKDIKSQLLKTTSSDFFIFSGEVEHQELFSLFQIKASEDKEMFFNIISKNRIKLTMSEHDANEYFLYLSKQDKPVHWLAVEESDDNCKQLVWRCSHGSLDGLRKCIDHVRTKEVSYDETRFTEEVKKKIIIIADEPGMGKSTTLTSLSIPKSQTNWIIYISFKDCIDAIKALPTNEASHLLTVDTICNFLLRKENANLERSLMKHRLQQQTKSVIWPLLLIFDGFDEIDNECHKKIIPFLQFLKKKTSAAIWVTTRPYKKLDLENGLSSFAIKFVEFNKKKQLEFLKYFWELSLSLVSSQDSKHSIKEKLEIYAKALLGKTTGLLHGRKTSFMGIPLQLRLLAEGFKARVKTFTQVEDNKALLFKNLTVVDMYQHFIDARYDIYFKEKINLEHQNKFIRNSLTESFNKDHIYLAFKRLFPDRGEIMEVLFVEQRCFDKEEENDLKSLGIVQSIGSEDTCYFIHVTFAEYFVAMLFVNCLNREENHPLSYQLTKQFLMTQLFENRNKVIRMFIDYMLAKGSAFHIAVLDCNISEIKNLLQQNENKTLVDKLERTALHLAAQEGYVHIVDTLLIAGFDALEKDAFSKTSLHYAAQHGHSKVIEHIVKFCRDIDVNDHIFREPLLLDMEIGGSIFEVGKYPHSKLLKLINILDNDSKSSLSYATEKRHWRNSCLLLLYGADCDVLAEEQQKVLLLLYAFEENSYPDHKFRPVVGLLSIKVPHAVPHYCYPKILSYFFEDGHIKVINALLNSIKDESMRKHIANEEDNFSRPLDSVNNNLELSDHNRLRVIQYLLDNDITETNKRMYLIGESGSYISKILQSAALSGHIETFKFLINKELKTNYHLHFRAAAEYNHLNIVKYLWENHKDDIHFGRYTALDLAIKAGTNFQIIEYLLDNGAKNNECNINYGYYWFQEMFNNNKSGD